MTSRVSGALLSTAVVSGLLLSPAAAQADETVQSPTAIAAESSALQEPAANAPAALPVPSEPVQLSAADVAEPVTAAASEQAPPENEPAEAATDPAASPEETAAPAENDTKTERTEPEPAESTAPTVADQPTTDQAPANGSGTTDEDNALVTEVPGSAEKSAPAAQSEGGPVPKKQEKLNQAPEPAAETRGDDTRNLASRFAANVNGMTFADEDAFWDYLDERFPQVDENWTEEQWEAFFKTAQGREWDRLVDEYLEQSSIEDPDLSDEEQAWLDEVLRLLPEGSESWDEAQWEQFFSTDQGRKLLGIFLGIEFDMAQSEAELKELIESYRELLEGEDAAWFEDFLAWYFGDQTESGNDKGKGEVKPSSNASPQAAKTPEATIVGAAVAHKVDTEDAAAQAKAPASDAALADTGFGGVLAAGAGLLVILLGGVFLRLARKNTAR